MKGKTKSTHKSDTHKEGKDHAAPKSKAPKGESPVTEKAPDVVYPLPQVKPDQQPERKQGTEQPERNEKVIADLKGKYPQLTEDDFCGNNHDIAAKISATLGMPYGDAINILEGRQQL